MLGWEHDQGGIVPRMVREAGMAVGDVRVK